MAAVPDLSGIAICERDADGELMFVWVYPNLEFNLKALLLRKCEILTEEHPGVDYCFNQTNKKWYYIKRSDVRSIGMSKQVTDVYLIILAQNFNPELYEALAKVCLKSYQKDSSTSPILNHYLSMYTKGFCLKDDSTKLMHTDYDKKKAYMNTCVKEMITLFGMEAILIYTAVLLKKRVVIYSQKLTTLHHVCRSLPAFVIHRLNWDIVHPFVHLEESELNELKTQRSYVAGFTNAEVENKSELYDIFLHVPDGEIVLNPHSKEFFQMGKMHKEIAKFLVQSSEDEDLADEDIVRELTRKTKDIITNLKSLDEENPTNPQISLEMLQSRNLTNVMQSFLYNLASAEGIVKL